MGLKEGSKHGREREGGRGTVALPGGLSTDIEECVVSHDTSRHIVRLHLLLAAFSRGQDTRYAETRIARPARGPG